MHLPGTLKYRYQLLQPSCDFGSMHVAILHDTWTHLFPRDGWHHYYRYAPVIFPVWIQCQGGDQPLWEASGRFCRPERNQCKFTAFKLFDLGCIAKHLPWEQVCLWVSPWQHGSSSACLADFILACSVNPLDLQAAMREAYAVGLLPIHQPTVAGKYMELKNSSGSGNVSSLSVCKDLMWGVV